MKVLVGVCGGVAAYKAAELVRELQRRGAQVQVVMTAGAERFVAPLTFAALSGRQVLTSLWRPVTREMAGSDSAEFDIEHIRVAQQIDAMVIAPATANVIAKLAHGMADDLLSTIYLATTAQVVLAPAMNVNMWWNPATQKNIDTLRAVGVRVVDPVAGDLACGMVGAGRLADPVAIAEAVMEAGGAAQERAHDLAGETILITAGGTREPIDAVRFIGNRSSGKMGLALAQASLARGAEVILIAAPVSGAASLACEQIHVNTAVEMQEAVLAQLPRASTVLMAAAVSDYRVLQPAAGKLKKTGTLTLELVQNEDILRQIVLRRRPNTLVIGFAAETESVLEEGRRKLREKGIDAILANDVSRRDRGFDVDYNAGFLLTRGEEFLIPLSSKREMADRILDSLRSLRAARVSELSAQRSATSLHQVLNQVGDSNAREAMALGVQD
jgi:phosphopantothenoylcysteine decarboxylase/phosphopantothenate--cysteine ligase